MRQSVRNPLGLFALFVTAMYAVTAVVFEKGLDQLCGACERQPIIWFLAGFPVIILLTFVYLVVEHPEKLYGPGDYRSDEAFLRSIMSKEKKRDEIQHLADAVKVSAAPSEEEPAPSDGQVVYQNSTADKKAGHSFMIVARPACSPRVTMEEYSRIEALAVDWVSREYDVPMERDVVLNDKGRRCIVDAMGCRDGVHFVVEVKYWLADRDLQPLFAGIDRFVSQARFFRRLGRSELVLIVVLDRKVSSVEDKIRAHVDKLEPNVCLHVLSREELSLGFGV